MTRKAPSGVSGDSMPSQDLPSSPNRFCALRAVTALGAAAVAMAVYAATAAPSAWWGDGLELSCAAKTLGVAHPPGYPLFCMTGWAITHLFSWADPGRVLTFAGALWTALGIGLLVFAFAAQKFLEGGSGENLFSKRFPPVVVPAFSLGLILAFSRSLWDQATYVEVYPLTFLFACAIAAMAWTAPRRPARPVLRSALMGALGGMALLNHYSILALAPLAAISVWNHGATAAGRAKCFGAAALAFLVMLAGYLYLPLRAVVNPPLNWGDPSNWERFKWMLTGGQFGEVHIAFNQSSPFTGFMRWVMWWGEQWLPLKAKTFPWQAVIAWDALWCVSVVAGLILFIRRRPALGWGFLISLGATAVFAMGYRIPDIESYFLVALPATGAGWWALGAALAKWLEKKKGAPLTVRHCVILFLLAMIPFLMHYRAVDKSWDDAPLVWGGAAFDALPEGAAVLTMGDNDIYALWYQQMALGKRPDLTVCGTGFIFSGWYAKYFESPDRPASSIVIQERGIVRDQAAYDAALFHNVILPCAARGQRIFATAPRLTPPNDGSAWLKYARPKPAAILIDTKYYNQTAYPFRSALPGPALYELDVDRSLLDMDEAALYALFRNMHQAPSGTSGPLK